MLKALVMNWWWQRPGFDILQRNVIISVYECSFNVFILRMKKTFALFVRDWIESFKSMRNIDVGKLWEGAIEGSRWNIDDERPWFRLTSVAIETSTSMSTPTQKKTSHQPTLFFGRKRVLWATGTRRLHVKAGSRNRPRTRSSRFSGLDLRKPRVWPLAGRSCSRRSRSFRTPTSDLSWRKSCLVNPPPIPGKQVGTSKMELIFAIVSYQLWHLSGLIRSFSKQFLLQILNVILSLNY